MPSLEVSISSMPKSYLRTTWASRGSRGPPIFLQGVTSGQLTLSISDHSLLFWYLVFFFCVSYLFLYVKSMVVRPLTDCQASIMLHICMIFKWITLPLKFAIRQIKVNTAIFIKMIIYWSKFAVVYETKFFGIVSKSRLQRPIKRHRNQKFISLIG